MIDQTTIITAINARVPGVKPYFKYGTLWYSGTEDESRRVFSTVFRLDPRIRVSRAGVSEYAIDFVSDPMPEEYSPHATINS